MIKKLVFIICLTCTTFWGKAQLMDAFVHEGEFGISAGLSHYFGDLTAGMDWQKAKPKFAAGINFYSSKVSYIV